MWEPRRTCDTNDDKSPVFVVQVFENGHDISCVLRRDQARVQMMHSLLTRMAWEAGLAGLPRAAATR